MDHGIYKAFVLDKNGIHRIVESRHITFDESRFPGAPALEQYMDDESESDETFENESGSESDIDSVGVSSSDDSCDPDRKLLKVSADHKDLHDNVDSEFVEKNNKNCTDDHEDAYDSENSNVLDGGEENVEDGTDFEEAVGDKFEQGNFEPEQERR